MHITTTITLKHYLYTCNYFYVLKFNNDVALCYNIAIIYPLFISSVNI